MTATKSIFTNRQRIAIGEELVWQQLKERKVFGLSFARQYPFYLQRPDGERVVFMTDFYSHAAGIAIRIINCEAVTIDSAETAAWAKSQLEMKGLMVIELPCDQIADVKQVLQTIKYELKYRAGHPQSTVTHTPTLEMAVA